VRRLTIITLIVVAVAAALAGVAMAGATRSIRVSDNYFVRPGSPPTVNVGAGTRIVWRWNAVGPHNVTVTSGPVRFHSATMYSGTFSRTLTRRGTYRIVCTVHPNMKMTIKVS
jgi:plastocyanin